MRKESDSTKQNRPRRRFGIVYRDSHSLVYGWVYEKPKEDNENKK